MALLVGTGSPEWGLTALAEGFGKLYALRSLPDESSVCVFTLPDGLSGVVTPDSLVKAGEFRTLGRHSCHISLLSSQAVVCNYTSGTLTLIDLDEEGIPSGDPCVVCFDGSGPDPVRQTSPHIHSSWITPDGQAIVVADLGSDRIYRFAVTDGKVDVSSRQNFLLPAGCGPRHCAFNSAGSRLYVATELSDEVLVYSYPEMELLQRCTVNEERPHGGAHIVMSPDCHYLYASSRLKNDGIAMFEVRSDGQLEKCSYSPTGAHPRHFAISEDGMQLICADKDDDSLEFFSISGGMLEKQKEYKIDKPVFVIIKQ